MKKLVIAASGHPRTNHDLLHLQDAITEIGSALGMMCSDNGITALTLIAGLKYTDLGGAFTYGVAYFYYNEEIFYFAGTSANSNQPNFLRINSAFTANNPYFGKNIHNIRTLIPIYGAGIVGDIPFVYGNFADNIISKAKNVTENWRYVGAVGQIPWQNNFSSGTVNSTNYNLRFRKIFGIGYITGSIDFNPFSSLSGNNQSLVICILPVGYRPDIQYSYSTREQVQTGYFTAQFTLFENGLLRCRVILDAGVNFSDLNTQWGGSMLYFTFAIS